MNLSEQFQQSQGAPISLDGQLVHAIFRRNIDLTIRVTVTFVSSVKDVVQCLRLKVDKGTMSINGEDTADVILTTDSAPAVVSVLVQPVRRGGTVLKIWNAWKDEAGTLQAWLGNAGMQIEESPSEAILRCSDGVGPPSFSDLVARLEFATS